MNDFGTFTKIANSGHTDYSKEGKCNKVEKWSNS